MTEQLNTWVSGGCHCGAVRFKVWVDTIDAIQCNCSICAKKGFVNLISKPENFELLQGEENLSTYQFNTKVAQHRFCKTCGVHPFSRPRSHPDGIDVNARCLDGGYEFLNIRPFDGQNWEQSVHEIQ